MATIRKREGRWQAQVRRRGNLPLSKTFDTKAQAQKWARGVERDIDEGKAVGRAASGTIADIIDRYKSDAKRMERSKRSSLGLIRDGIGHVQLRDLTVDVLIRFGRERAAAGAGPVTLAIDFAYLGTLLRHARIVWRLNVSEGLARDAREGLVMLGMIGKSRQRDRRPTPAELAAIKAYFEANKRQHIPMAAIVDFAVASAMRREEICRIAWADLDEAARIVVIRDRKDPKEKEGNDARVPLIAAGGLDPMEIILRQPRGEGAIFPYRPASISTAFQRACAALGIDDLNFHDLRHEGASRLFETGYQIQEVAMVTGHKDWRTLRRYTHLRPEGLVMLSASRGRSGTASPPRSGTEPDAPAS